MVIKNHNVATNLTSEINITPAEEADYIKRKKLQLNNRIRSKRIVSGVRKTAATTVSKAIATGYEAENEVENNTGNAKDDVTKKELTSAKKLIRHAYDDTKLFAKTAGRILGKKTEKAKDAADDTEYQGNRGNKENPEYRGIRTIDSKKSVTALVSYLFFQMMALLKLVVSAMTNIIVVIVVVIIVVVVITVAVIQNATYGFIVDEEAHIREIMSNVTHELTAEINTQKLENGCDTVSSSGYMADWKEIIALWWTLKNNISETDSWDNYFSGADQDDIEYIFYQFNHIEYEVVDNTVGGAMGEENDTEGNTTGHKVLKVNITNTTLEELRVHWGLTDAQNIYLDSLLADEEIWEEILGTTELSRIAFGEIGNAEVQFYDWYGENDGESSTVFVVWCLAQAGCISDAFIPKTDDPQELMYYFVERGFIEFFHKPEEGDVVFLDINGKKQCGIVTYVTGQNFTVTMLGFTGHTYVEEIVLAFASQNIICYGRINDFFVEGLSNPGTVKLAEGDFVWPATGCYNVTSAYKWRWGRQHQGTDIGAPTGTPIVAAKEGTVTSAGWSDSMGYYVFVSHGEGMATVYMHNSELIVETGQLVEAGQLLAYSGNTGNSTGPHCHFGVRIDGIYVDPAPYLGIPKEFEGDATRFLTN